jgi:hypothetical protein
MNHKITRILKVTLPKQTTLNSRSITKKHINNKQITSPHVYGAKIILKDAPMILQSFFSLPKSESVVATSLLLDSQEQ